MTRHRPDLAGLPSPGDATLARQTFERWQKLDLVIDRSGNAAGAIDVEGLLMSLFGNSPFLTSAAFATPDTIKSFVELGPDQAFSYILDGTRGLRPSNRAALMSTLRHMRKRVALIAALADISGLWPLETVTKALSLFADAATDKALHLALSELAARGDLIVPSGDEAPRRSGMIVLGMGKLGAYELNYSSDIDLIVLFDPERFNLKGKGSAMALAVRMVRTLVYVLEHRTKDGYVFRTDLRLRPHPPGQPLALSVDDAETYYERFGQNWERAALIKARVVAGDQEAGKRFLENISPFIWRRHLDYAAIRDIHAIKRQINSHRGHGRIRVKGHDLKVGRGGIREIEFFVQTQQLILGGRVPELRLRGTIETLAKLVAKRWLKADTARELTEAYGYFRTVEHRLQMVADKQTHKLPEDQASFENIAIFMNEPDADAFKRRVKTQLEKVERHYAALFESSLDLSGGGTLVFTGTDDDPATLKTLERMGFEKPVEIAQVIRSWHHGHIRATRTSQARELLTELTPELLRALGDQADPDAAFKRFEHFMTTLPAGVQLFSLFRANPKLLALVTDLMGIAPRLASHLSRNTALFDTMLAPYFFEPLGSPVDFDREFRQALDQANGLEDALDMTRRWTHEREFQIGIQILLGQSDGAKASEPLTAMAETAIRSLLPLVEDWLAEQHGRMEDGSFAVLALGKLGSAELSIGSDLDLIFVFDAPPGKRSSGPRPLPPEAYYARLGQRLVSALTAKTAEGVLYDIDTRLRPSGNLGPVACSIESFRRYQLEHAQAWEHQALTRCRVVAGPSALKAKVGSAIHAALTRPRDPHLLAADIRMMRLRIFKEYGDDDPWRLKHVRGGLIEAEFLAQFMQLRYASENDGILDPSTIGVFKRAAGYYIQPKESRQLIDAVTLYRRIQAILRLSLDGPVDPQRVPKGLETALIRATSIDPELDRPGLDMVAVGGILAAMQKVVRNLFDLYCPMPPLDASPGEIS